MPARILSLRHHITPDPHFCHDTFRHVRFFDARDFYVACNFETNGDGAEMFKLELDRPILNIYACVVAQPRPR